MFNIRNSIDALRDADTIMTSSILKRDERMSLMAELVASIPDLFSQPHVSIVRNAIVRTLPEEQRRKAEGQQDAPEVAERSPEAAKGSPEGGAEQAQDAGRVDRADAPRAAAPSSRPAAAKGPRKGRARP